MRLFKGLKFKMIIAILLCMAFVVNIGATLASVDYNFKASSVNKVEESVNEGDDPIIHYDTYTSFASAESASGKYVYKQGTTNNQLSVNYGFDSKKGEYAYDLMIKFTASYTDKGATNINTHLANDFTINFVNRDKWLIDMGVFYGRENQGNTLVENRENKYYITSSDTTSISGVMYYMETVTESGSLPIISGVTFHTSQNNSYQYIGDELTITITPYYVKSKADNYKQVGQTNQHRFYDNACQWFAEKSNTTADADAFNSWISYMSRANKEIKTASQTSVMIYNHYVDDARSISFPMDDKAMEKSNGEYTGAIDKTIYQQPNYTNTAYRYSIGEVNDLPAYYYDAITAGNKYYGGLGLYVVPSADLITVSISFSHFWQKNNVLAGSSDSEFVEFNYCNQIYNMSATKKYYYNADIEEPTYINVLDCIQITAEDYASLISGGYSLILDNISVGTINRTYNNDTQKYETPSEISALPLTHSKTNYEIHNSTINAPVLARAQDVAANATIYETNVSITNNSESTISIQSVTISTGLWYEDYGADGTSKATKTSMGYLTETIPFVFDSSLWRLSKVSDGVFKLSRLSGVTYVPSGYAITIISGVKVQAFTPAENESVANDFWCSLEVTNVETGSVNYSASATTGVEAIVDGYYRPITNSNPGYIYIRNNTSQVITSFEEFTPATLNIMALSGNAEFMPRQQVTSTTTPTYELEYMQGDVSIKPGEMVLMCSIIPDEGVTAIIYSYKVTANLETEQYTDDVVLTYSESTSTGVITNNSDKYYEIRIIANEDISSKFADNVNTKFKQIITQDDGGNDVYEYYYVGVIMPNRCIKVFKEFAQKIEIEYRLHNQTSGPEGYKASSYSSDWKLDDTIHKDWFDAMKSLYTIA